jgi:hypothetical protein
MSAYTNWPIGQGYSIEDVNAMLFALRRVSLRYRTYATNYREWVRQSYRSQVGWIWGLLDWKATSTGSSGIYLALFGTNHKKIVRT